MRAVSMQIEMDHETVLCLAWVLVNDQGLIVSFQTDISDTLMMWSWN